ncbi:hypothetical protein [Anaerocolumna aminovalerica]|uniref:hypothetical protein n=1 Tax=Anaerocolumna aminovalerica TaxID=1527 RepID=UPI000BE3FA77|nr:hypothetical protein [Anaerocolumna aminovalerica]
MIKKYTAKRMGIVILSALLLLLTGVGLYYHVNKRNNIIHVTGEANNVFTIEYFKNLVEIEDTPRRLSIKDKDKLQVICQALSELRLTEVKERETDPARIKFGHSLYRFNYSDGSFRSIAMLSNQIIVDKVLYEASVDINDLIREEFK